jgi:transcriptional regulator with XRE-family HTH domain
MAESARVYPLRRAPQPEAPSQEPPAPEPLWREVLGRRLRALRQERRETLAETAARAGLSPQYLSEVERGRKEASSELLAAICAALDTPLSQVFREVSDNFTLAELQNEPVLSGAPREPGLRVPAERVPADDSAQPLDDGLDGLDQLPSVVGV